MDHQNDEGAKCSDIESPTCTACGKQFPLQKAAFFAHPVLNVIICKGCNSFYKRSSFSKDENGIDNSCRWCGNGGDLICCDSCPNAFHKKCVSRNVSEENFNIIAFSDEWACFVCDPSPISKHVEFCKNVLEHLSKMSELEVSSSGRNRKPFLSPNSKMPPKVAMSRCIDNCFHRSKVFRDAVADLRQKLESSANSSEVRKVGERFRNCIILANETNVSILKSIDQVLQRLNPASENNNDSSNNSYEMKEADSQNLGKSNKNKDKNKGLKLGFENGDTEEEEPMETNNDKTKVCKNEESNSAIVNNSVVDSDDEKLVDIAKRKKPSLKSLERMKRKNRPMPKSAKARQVETEEEEFETCGEGDDSAENGDFKKEVAESKTEKIEEIENEVDKEESERSDESSKPLSKKRSKVSKNRKEGNSISKPDENCDIEKTVVDSETDKKVEFEEDDGKADELQDEECPESDESSKPLSKKRSKGLKTDKKKITKANQKNLKDIDNAKILANEEGETEEIDSEVKDQSAMLTDEGSKLNECSDSEVKEKSDLGTDDEGKLDESVSKTKKQSKKSEKVGDENDTSDSKAKKQSKKSEIVADNVDEIGEKKGKKNSKKSKSTVCDKEKLPTDNAASEDLKDEENDAPSEEKNSEEVSVDLKDDVIESSVINEEELDENTAENFKRKLLFDNLKLDETDADEDEKKNEEKENATIKAKESGDEEFLPKADPVDENGWKNEAEDLENEIAEKLQKEHAVMHSPNRKANTELNSTPENDEFLNDSKVDSGTDSEKTLILSRSTSKSNSVEDKAKNTPRSLALKKSPETAVKKASENATTKIKPCLFSSSTDDEAVAVKNEKAKLDLIKILGADSSDEEMKPTEEVESVKSEEKVSKKFDKQKKFDSLLKSVIKNSSDELSDLKKKNFGEKKSPRKMKSTPKNDFASPLDDPKLKMKAVVVVKKLKPLEIEFALENGIKAYKRRQRGLNSDDEEFLRACDFRSLRLRKKNVKEKASVSEKSDIESDAKESKKKPMRGAKKKSSRLDNLLSGDESSGKSDDDCAEDSKKRSSSSDSEPTFKTADQLAKESLLKDLATTSSEDGDEDDDDDAGELDSDKDTKKTSKKSKRKASSDSDEWKKYDSEDDFVPVKKNRRLRSKLTSNDSDSNDSTVGKKVKKRRRDSDGDKTSSSSQTSAGSKKKNGKRKRRRIKVASSSDSSVQEVSGDDSKNTPRSRKNIRKLISDNKLASDTKAATREEDERKKRVAELQKKYNEEFREDGEKGMRITTKLKLAEAKDTGEIIEVNENLIRKLKPHQVEGVKFMWECVGESVDRLDTTPGSGCILAHCMGLGKTLQVITFLHTVLTREKKNFPRTALVVCPLNIVLNWYNECSQWLDDVQPSLTILEMSRFRTHPDRAVTLKNWYKSGGILIMGYDMFRNLVQENNKRIPKSYRDIFHSKLINPGPDIVVCDEGHILKNANTGISKAMIRISTKRRIILTGTPLQNNLTEYHCMVNFVKENLLGNMKEFQNRFVNPINNGQHTDSTSTDVRIMKNRAHVLHTLLDGCVQRRDYNVLTPFLPPKYEYVLDIRLTEIQIKLYTYYLENMCSRLQGKAQLFADYQNLMKIWTHPRVIRLAEIRQENKANYDSIDSFLDDNSESSSAESSVILDDSDSDKPGTSKKAKPQSDTEDVVNKWKTRSRSKNIAENNKEDGKKPIEEDSLDSAPLNTWWTGIISEDDAKKVEHGGKLLILFDILKQCEEIGDKVLLFSQSLLSLDFIESIINGDDPVIGSSIPHECKMVRGFDYFRLDGSTSAENRSKFTKMFNNKKNLRARLFLISTKAGSLGINLVAANRVIIFDASWNPTHDIQSIFRVYRFGQVKPVYIYRFVSHGTMEEKIYDRQVTKQSLACRVIDEQQIERHFSFADLQELYTFQPENVKKRSTPVLPKDKLLADLLSQRKELIVSYHEHDSLLVNVEGEELTEDERVCAWVEYSFDRTLINTEGLYTFDIHKEVQDLQKQFPGLNVNDLSSKLHERVVAAAAEQRIQKQLILQARLQQNLITQQNMQQLAAQQNYQLMAQQQNAQQMAQQNALHGLLAKGTNMTPAQYQQIMHSQRQTQHLMQQQQAKYYKTNDTNRHLGKIDLNQMVKQQQNQSLLQNTVANAMGGANKPKSVLKPLEKPFL